MASSFSQTSFDPNSIEQLSEIFEELKHRFFQQFLKINNKVKQYVFPSSSSSSSAQPSSMDNNDDKKRRGGRARFTLSNNNKKKQQKKRLNYSYKHKCSQKQQTHGDDYNQDRNLAKSRSSNSQNVYESKSSGMATTNNDYDDSSTYLFDSPTSSFGSTNENMSRNYKSQSASNSNHSSNGNSSLEYGQYQSNEKATLRAEAMANATAAGSDSSTVSDVLNAAKMKQLDYIQAIASTKRDDSLPRRRTSNSHNWHNSNEIESLDNIFSTANSKNEDESLVFDDSLCVKLMQNYIDLVKCKKDVQGGLEGERSPSNSDNHTTTSSTTVADSPSLTRSECIPKAQLSALAKQHQQQKEENLKQMQQNQQSKQEKQVIFNLDDNESSNELVEQTEILKSNEEANATSDSNATETVRSNQ